jgi:hypothetical protein
VYRGYTASKALQELCDSAIKSRTELKLKQEAAEAAQRLKDMELRRRVRYITVQVPDTTVVSIIMVREQQQNSLTVVEIAES